MLSSGSTRCADFDDAVSDAFRKHSTLSGQGDVDISLRSGDDLFEEVEILERLLVGDLLLSQCDASSCQCFEGLQLRVWSGVRPELVVVCGIGVIRIDTSVMEP